MKKYFKKISALLMAAIMVLSMCTAVFAAGDTTAVPNKKDAAQVTINGLEAGVTVKAYQIVKGDYNNNGFKGFEWTELAGKGSTAVFTNDGTLNLSQADLVKIVAKIGEDTSKVEFKLDSNNKSSEALTVGTWLLLVSGGTKVYNPMVVSVYYSNENGAIIGGELKAEEPWTLVGGSTYAKETEITIDKVADKDTAAHGDLVNFTITGVIPSYSAEYTDVTYTISDTLTNLELQGDPVVNLAGNTIDAANYTYSKTDAGFSIVFNSDYIEGLVNLTDAQRTVTVTYKAKVTAAATTWNPAKNHADVEYTNNPNNTTTRKETETNTYTFDIDGQILKVGVDKDAEALAGAEFTLYRTYDAKTKTVSDPIDGRTMTTGVDGKVVFKGLDADTYYLTETKAPASYTLNTTVYKIVITPTYEAESSAAADGKKTLKSYTVAISEMKADGTEGEATTATYESASTEITKLVTIQNTKVGQLPSTGGMGTYIFTIAGVVLMACAAGAFIISRKKSSEE